MSDRSVSSGAAPLATEPRTVASFPLSPLQEGLLFHAELDARSRAYCIQQSYRVTGALDARALARALAALVDRHAALRTGFGRDASGAALQFVRSPVVAALREHDLRGLAPEARQARVAELLAADLDSGFDLKQPPLFRLTLIRIGDELHHLIKTVHHLITDGGSSLVLMRDLALFYHQALGHPIPPLPPPLEYRRYVEWLASRSREATESFWREHWAGLDFGASLIARRAPGASEVRDHAVNLDEATTASLTTLARGWRLTLNTLVQGVWAVTLARQTGSSDSVFGVTVSGRPPELEGAEHAVGLYINTLPIRLRVTPAAELPAWLERVQGTNAALREHQYVALPEIQAWAGVAHDRPLFDSLFVFENYARPSAAATPGAPLRLERTSLRDATHYPLTLYVTPGSTLGLRFSYDARRCDRAQIERLQRGLVERLERLASHASTGAAPPPRVGDLCLPTPSERAALERSSGVRELTPCEWDLPTLLRRAAALHGQRTALEFRGDRLDYGALWGNAEALALELRRRGIGMEQRVALLAERGFELVIGMLGVMLAGAAYVPLEPSHPPARLEWLIRDAEPALLLHTASLGPPAFDASCECLELRAADVGTSDTSGERAALHERLPPQRLAYMMYTSGSTGAPKAVQISEQNLASFLHAMSELLLPAPGERWLAITSIGFDICAVELLLPLLHGGTVVLVEAAVARDGERLANALASNRIDWFQATPSTWGMLLDAGWSGQPSLRALSGGEALSSPLAARLRPRVAQLCNVYGPTETSVWSSAWVVPEHVAASGSVRVGRPLCNTSIHVLDRGRDPLAAGGTGEITIGGAGVARGYWKSPGRTAARFLPDPFAATPGSRRYATGDLGRWDERDELECLGRTDHQVKLRGQRIELGEIERGLCAHPDVSAAAVVLVAPSDGNSRAGALATEPRLVGYVVARSECTDAELQRFLAARLPAAMVPSAFVRLERLPLTPNGKLDRRALPSPSRAAATAPLAETTALNGLSPEAVAAAIWCDVLGIGSIELGSHFFQAGGHSLSAARVMARLRAALGCELPLRLLFDAPRFGDFSSALLAALSSAPSLETLAPAPPAADYPLSFAQERLWFLHELEPERQRYNLVVALQVRATRGAVRGDALDAAFRRLAWRHPSLRTRFSARAGEPRQVIDAAVTLAAEERDLRGLPSGEPRREIERAIDRAAHRRFDLEVAPAWSVERLVVADDQQLIVFAVHHILADAVSLAILLHDLAQLSAGEAAELASGASAPRGSYVDHCVWQRSVASMARAQAALAYFRAALAGAPPRSSLPRDPGCAAQPRRSAGRQVASIEAATLEALRRVCRAHDVTLFMLLFSALAATLARTTGQRDLCLGTPMSGRRDAALERAVGLFVNLLVLRLSWTGDPRFGALLRQARSVALAAYTHQDAPFERLVAELSPARELDQPPLCQVVLSLEPDASSLAADTRQLLLDAGLEVALLPAQPRDPKFELVLHVVEQEQRLLLGFEYDTGLFEPSSIAAFADRFVRWLDAAAADPEARLSELDPPSPSELDAERRAQRPLVQYSIASTLPAALARRSAARPEAIAVSCGQQTLSYAELERRSNAVAWQLLDHGVRPEQRVALCLERSLERVVALVGVLKAGAAYVPLEPQLPAARQRRLLDDSDARIVLGAALEPDALPSGVNRLALAEPDARAARPPEVSFGADHLAYVIYTSGSTGAPKGVGVSHAQVLRLFAACEPHFEFGPSDVWSVFHSYAFDFSVWELWGALLYGGRAVLVPDEVTRNPRAFCDLLDAERVSVLSQTPSAFYALLDPLLRETRAPGLRYVVFGGEALDATRLRPWFERPPSAARLINMYGITETTVHVTYFEVTAENSTDLRSRIGVPLGDLGVALLDRLGNPAARGQVGEIHVSGAGVARGYLGRAGLTAERFLPDDCGAPGARRYRSGDLARRLDDGSLEFSGRADQQVQLRGHRIEPNEIALSLREHPGVAAAEVVLQTIAADPRLVAYVVPAAGAAPVAASELREHVRERLPAYMVPSHVVQLERLPLTVNGKLDRHALPLPDSAAPAIEYEAPRTRVEHLIADVWAEALGLERIGIHDDFFALGGHSLLAVRVMDATRRALGELPLAALFHAPTVAGLAALLGARSTSTRVVEIGAKRGVPVFLLHPGGGHLQGYAPLADRLATAGFAARGIPSRMVFDRDFRDPSIDEMAARYARAIDEHLRSGSASNAGQGIALLGWSLGGVLALAVAEQMERSGVELAFLGLVDAPLPGIATKRERGDLVSEYFLQLGAERNDPRLAALDPGKREKLAHELERAPGDEARLEIALEFAQNEGLISKNLSLGVCSWRRDALEHAALLISAHSPRPVSSDIHLWLAQSASTSAPERAHSFARLTRGTLHARPIEASHAEIIRSPACLDDIVRALLTALPRGKSDNPNTPAEN